jgi:multiple sugar transport system substrate-binding protein
MRTGRRRFVLGIGASALLAACGAPAAPTPAPSAAKPPAEAAKPAADPTKPAAAPAGEPTKPAAAPAAAATKPAEAAKPAEGAKPAAAPAAKPVAGGRELSLTIWANVTPGEQARAAHFTSLNPNVKTAVASQGTGGQGAEAVQKFLTAVAAGQAAPVVFFDRFQIASYGHRNAFMPLDDRIKSDNFDLKRFSDATLRECYGIDGKLYGLPRHFVNRYYLMNADLLKEAGLDPEAPLRDWQHFKEVSTKLTKKDGSGKITQVGFQPTIDMAYTWGWSNGGEWVSKDGRKATMNDPRNVEAYEFALSVAEAMGGQEAIAGFASTFQADAGDPFLVGQAAMKFNGNTFLRQLARYKPTLNLRTSYYATKAATDPRQSWAAGHAWVIPRATKEADVAWEIVKSYMTFDSVIAYQEADKAVSDKAGTAFLPELTGQPEIDQRLAERYRTKIELVDKAFQFGLDIMSKAPVVHVRPQSPAALEMWDAVGVALDETLRKKKPAAVALKDANDKMQAVLDEAWSTQKS